MSNLSLIYAPLHNHVTVTKAYLLGLTCKTTQIHIRKRYTWDGNSDRLGKYGIRSNVLNASYSLDHAVMSEGICSSQYDLDKKLGSWLFFHHFLLKYFNKLFISTQHKLMRFWRISVIWAKQSVVSRVLRPSSSTLTYWVYNNEICTLLGHPCWAMHTRRPFGKWMLVPLNCMLTQLTGLLRISLTASYKLKSV